MKNKISVFCILTTLSYSAHSQAVFPDPVIDRTTAGIRELKPPPPETDANKGVYVNDQWTNGNITFKSDFVIKDVPIKYDLKNNILEIQTSAGVKIAHKSDFKLFEFDHEIEKHTFLNADVLHINGFTGLVEKLVTGELSLYAKLYLKLIKANYNAAMDVGERSDKYVKEESLYIVKNNEVFDITKSGKKILGYFGDRSEAIQAYVKQHNLSYKDKYDLMKIVAEYNKSSEK